jgi:tungstate transport system substrate-binding protein
MPEIRHKQTFAALLLCLILACAGSLHAEERLKMATTTSTENSGLLGTILPPFEKMCNLKVDVIAVGTGKAMKLGETGDVDVILVHDPIDEERFVAQGYGVNRREVMHNDFVLVGPPGDPAGCKGIKNIVEVFSKIFRANALFVSRGDDSGTHRKEKDIWAKAGIIPQGNWYLEAGQGMGAVLQMAHDKMAYTLADRGTYVAYTSKIDSIVISEGDLMLHNPYGVIAVNPARHPQVNYIKAMAFIGWLTSPGCQQLISNFKQQGEVLFYPDAIPKSKTQ